MFIHHEAPFHPPPPGVTATLPLISTMAVSASNPLVGGLSFFDQATGFQGIKSTVGVIQGMVVLWDPNSQSDRFLVAGTGGGTSDGGSSTAPSNGGGNSVQGLTHTPTSLKGRISWHELVR